MRFITIHVQAEIFLSYVLITLMGKIIAAKSNFAKNIVTRFTSLLIALNNNL